MKLTELIERCAILIKEYGDIEAVLPVVGRGGPISLEGIEPLQLVSGAPRAFLMTEQGMKDLRDRETN